MKDTTNSESSIERCITAVTPDLTVSYTLYGKQTETVTAYSLEATVVQTGESAVARDITRNEAKARRMFDMISLGGVTPCCLLEITEDLIEAIPTDIPEEKILL